MDGNRGHIQTESCSHRFNERTMNKHIFRGEIGHGLHDYKYVYIYMRVFSFTLRNMTRATSAVSDRFRWADRQNIFVITGLNAFN